LFNAERINYQVNLDELDLGSASKSDLNNGGSSSELKQIGFVYRASYNYSQKYMAEFSGRYDGHYYFAPGKRFAFFPAFSVGWQLSNENFIKDNIYWINNLKLRGSFGKSGNLAGGPFQYLSSYGLRAAYIFGGSQVQGAFERSEPNKMITWETAKKLDIGLEGLFFNGKLGFVFDVFKERRSDMLVPPTTTVPSEYGIGLSQVNGGIMDNQGFDLSLTTTNTFSHGFRVDAGITVSYAKNKLIDIIEGDDTYNNPNRRRTGRPLDTQFGLQALGLFQSQEEIDNWAKQFGKLQPGDIKYADINKDGKINNDDQVVIGNPAFPQLIYGLTGNFSWKGFSLSMLWQGAGKSNFLLTNEAATPFFNGAKIFKEQLDYWTPENRNATYPVIMPTPTPNSSQVSSWWIRNGRYLRLKNLELGYTIPSKIMERINLNSIRIFATGQNILTFSAEKYLDPEIGVNSGSKRARYYFQQKVYTVGLNVNF
jgi:TonB-linked SusC/RagA family outer membrane protein